MSTEIPTPAVSSRQTEKLVGKFDRTLKRSGDVLVDRFGEETAAVMRGEMLDEYRRLIPEVPYIGGRRNINSEYSGAGAVGVGGIPGGGQARWKPRGCRRVASPDGQSGDGADSQGAPSLDRETALRPAAQAEGGEGRPAVAGPPLSGGLGVRAHRRRRGDLRLRDRLTECGIVKYLHAQGADELCPYGCDLDYVMFEAMGIGLRRTKTLAWGCDRCDFRLSKHGVTSAPWPPEFVERTCGQPQTEERTAVS